MADFVFNVAKGRAAQFVANAIAGTGGAKIRVLALEAAGTDAALEDLDTVAAVLAEGSTDEATATGYARADVTSTLTRTVDDANDRQDADCDDISVGTLTGSALTDLVFYYDPDGSDTDSGSIPISQHDFAVTPDGSAVTATVAVFYRAS